MCESGCLGVEKMTPFARIFDKSAMFDMVEGRLRLYYVSVVFPIARDWALRRNPRVNLKSVARLKIFGRKSVHAVYDLFHVHFGNWLMANASICWFRISKWRSRTVRNGQHIEILAENLRRKSLAGDPCTHKATVCDLCHVDFCNGLMANASIWWFRISKRKFPPQQGLFASIVVVAL